MIKRARFVTIGRVAALILILGSWAQAQHVLENATLRLAFDPVHGHLLQMRDVSTGHENLAGDSIPLWVLVLDDGRMLAPEGARLFEADRLPDGSGLTLSWSEFQEDPKVSVQVRVSLVPGDVSASWRIRIDGMEDTPLRTVHFPRVPVARQGGEALAVPIWMGQLTHMARDLLNSASGEPGRWAWEYPGLMSLQCVAVSGDATGLLLSTRDTRHHWKQFSVFGNGQGGLALEVIHAPGDMVDAPSYEPPYDTMTGLYTGDWFTAAERYRAWASSQQWVAQSRKRQRSTPSWLLDTGLWVWNRGPSPGVLGPAAVLQEAAGVPVSVFWHWWHGCAYDAGFPEYLPPREGGDVFRRALEKAHDQGLHALVYMNQRLWGMTTESWRARQAERYAVKRPDGRVNPEVYNTFMNVPCASMCMGTAFWRDTYAEIAESAVKDYDVDGIYMDQACSSLPCYDSSHGHPLGGGTWWMEGFQRLESDIRARCASAKTVALSGEGCGEAWLPHLDAMLSLQVSLERYAAPGQWEPIPFFHAVYHDVATFYGNYSSLTRPPYDDLWPKESAPARPLELLDRKFAIQFRLEQARSFVWGQQPTIANFQPSHLEERREEMEFFMELARLRLSLWKYLRDGVMLRPPKIDSPIRDIPMSRLSIYAGQHDAVKEYVKAVPMVLAAAWRADDGGVAVALANIGEEDMTFPVALSRPEYPVSSAGQIYRVTSQGRETVKAYSHSVASFNVVLPPASVAVYEVVPSESHASVIQAQ